MNKTVQNEGGVGDGVLGYEPIGHGSPVLKYVTACMNVVAEADSVDCLQTDNVD